MTTVADLSDRYANFMVTPGPAGPSICDVCWTPCDPAYSRCYPCGQTPQAVDGMLPVTYSIDREQMHVALRGYKDGWGGDERDATRNRFTTQLAAVLTRFLSPHETCLVAAVGIPRFDTVTIVPPSSTKRWRLDWIVRKGCSVTRDRFEQLLSLSSSQAASSSQYDATRYRTSRDLAGKHVLLIDDTWTRGYSAQSAAAALKAAGAVSVGLVVIGRHISPGWKPVQTASTTNADILKAFGPWSWDRCAMCSVVPTDAPTGVRSP